jgi:hypothetical protein
MPPEEADEAELWHILHDDGDEQDMELGEMNEAIKRWEVRNDQESRAKQEREEEFGGEDQEEEEEEEGEGGAGGGGGGREGGKADRMIGSNSRLWTSDEQRVRWRLAVEVQCVKRGDGVAGASASEAEVAPHPLPVPSTAALAVAVDCLLDHALAFNFGLGGDASRSSSSASSGNGTRRCASSARDVVALGVHPATWQRHAAWRGEAVAGVDARRSSAKKAKPTRGRKRRWGF